MDNITIIAAASIISAGLTMGIGALGPGLGQGRAVAAAAGVERFGHRHFLADAAAQ